MPPILLIEQAPHRRRDALVRDGYEVVTATTLEEARRLWSPGRYALVVITLCGDSEDIKRFCDSLRSESPEQPIAQVFDPEQPIPATDCPTMLMPPEPEEYFLARVETLTQIFSAA